MMHLCLQSRPQQLDQIRPGHECGDQAGGGDSINPYLVAEVSALCMNPKHVPNMEVDARLFAIALFGTSLLCFAACSTTISTTPPSSNFARTLHESSSNFDDGNRCLTSRGCVQHRGGTVCATRWMCGRRARCGMERRQLGMRCCVARVLHTADYCGPCSLILQLY